jgi:hypothetical protein
MTKEFTINDPWLKESSSNTTIPSNAKLVCVYELNLVVDCIWEVAFLVSTKTHHQLWKTSGMFVDPIYKRFGDRGLSIDEFNRTNTFRSGIAYSCYNNIGEFSACLVMLERLFRAYYGYEDVRALLLGGVINESEFTRLVDRLNYEREIIRNITKVNETEIVRVAKELGLNPQPTGNLENVWRARCPKTKYGMYINALKNEYKCAVTKCKGGVEELRACVEKHQDNK